MITHYLPDDPLWKKLDTEAGIYAKVCSWFRYMTFKDCIPRLGKTAYHGLRRHRCISKRHGWRTGRVRQVMVETCQGDPVARLACELKVTDNRLERL